MAEAVRVTVDPDAKLDPLGEGVIVPLPTGDTVNVSACEFAGTGTNTAVTVLSAFISMAVIESVSDTSPNQWSKTYPEVAVARMTTRLPSAYVEPEGIVVTVPVSAGLTAVVSVCVVTETGEGQDTKASKMNQIKPYRNSFLMDISIIPPLESRS